MSIPLYRRGSITRRQLTRFIRTAFYLIATDDDYQFHVDQVIPREPADALFCRSEE